MSANHALGKGLVLAAASAAVTSMMSSTAHAGWIPTAAGTYSFNDTANWTGGTIDGVWATGVSGAQTVTFNADTTLPRLSIAYTNVSNLTFQSDSATVRTLTLNDMSLSQGSNVSTFFMNTLKLDLGGLTRTFDVANGGDRYLEFRAPVQGTNVTDGIRKTGAGTLYFNNGTSTYKGTTTSAGGTIWLASTAKNTDSDFVATTGGTIRFDSSGSGLGSIARTKSMTLAGAALTGTASTGTTANTNDQMGALTIASGGSTITPTPTSARHMRFTASDFSRNAGGAVLFRGTNLGVNTLASNTTGAASFVITTPPTLSGSGASGTSTVGILKGAYGAITTGSTGDGLVTYDTTYGVRVLGGSEYANALSGGLGYETTPVIQNIKLSNSSGTGVATSTLTSDAYVRSLSLSVSGVHAAAGSGITVGGTGTLKIASGMVYASQTITGAGTSGNALNAITISAPIDLDGAEGVFVSAVTTGVDNGTSNQPLILSGSIGNDGGKGVTFAGAGLIYFQGTGHTYTGPTYASGNLRLNASIPGDLVVSSGTTQNTGGRVGDSNDITINGGSLTQKGGALNSGSGASETFRDLTMNGGTFTGGASGTSSGSTTLRNAVLNGGTWTPTRGHTVNMSGTLGLAGGLLNLTGSSDSTSGASFNVAGINITHSPGSAYTAINIGSASGTGAAAKITLNGDLTFTGNATNPNTVLIDASTNTKIGAIALNGARAFNIGNGAAGNDLTVNALVTNSGATVGHLTKSGAGTLLLNGVNTYTGTTTVSAGTLALGTSGSIATSSGVTLNANAVLDTTAQAYALSSGQTVRFTLDPTGAGSSGKVSAGALDITNGVVQFDLLGTLNDPVYVLATYSSLSGSSFGSATAPEGYEFDYDYLGNSIALVTVPEPATLGVLGIAGLALMRKRRAAK